MSHSTIAIKLPNGRIVDEKTLKIAQDALGKTAHRVMGNNRMAAQAVEDLLLLARIGFDHCVAQKLIAKGN